MYMRYFRNWILGLLTVREYRVEPAVRVLDEILREQGIVLNTQTIAAITMAWHRKQERYVISVPDHTLVKDIYILTPSTNRGRVVQLCGHRGSMAIPQLQELDQRLNDQIHLYVPGGWYGKER